MSADLLHFQMTAVKLNPVLEYRFNKDRRWRADFAFPEQRVLVEFEGGLYVGGRHVRGKGYENDLEKYSTASAHGWCVLRFSAKHVKSGLALKLIEQAVERGRQVKRE